MLQKIQKALALWEKIKMVFARVLMTTAKAKLLISILSGNFKLLTLRNCKIQGSFQLTGDA